MRKIIFLYGPPAVGKLTIAKVLASKIDYRLLHNHLLVNPIAEVFPFENPANRLLTREFRLRIIEEAIKSNVNLINTFGIAGNNPFEHIEDIIKTVNTHNGEICLVHLTANKETLLNRVEDNFRKEHGKSLSKEMLKELFKENHDIFNKYQGIEHLSLNTSESAPDVSAETIINYYNLA